MAGAGRGRGSDEVGAYGAVAANASMTSTTSTAASMASMRASRGLAVGVPGGKGMRRSTRAWWRGEVEGLRRRKGGAKVAARTSLFVGLRLDQRVD